jgi:hypothetical protein
MTGRTRTEDRQQKKLDAELDTALAETFPASDPFSVGQFTATEPPSRSIDHQAPRPEAGRPSRRPRKAKG